MSNVNHNNFTGWKAKLEDLDSLPGENSNDKNAAWEKLYAQMGGEKHSKKVIWYWAAAACILFAMLIPLLYHENRSHQLSSKNTQSSHPEINNSSNTIIDKKDPVQNINSLMIRNKKEIASTEYPEKTTNIIREKQNEKYHLYHTANYNNITVETKNNSLMPIDTSVSIVAMIPANKKLRVVQINELGDPVESQPGLVRNTDNHSFQFKFANQEIFTNPSVASAEKGFTILKIKLLQTK